MSAPTPSQSRLIGKIIMGLGFLYPNVTNAEFEKAMGISIKINAVKIYIDIPMQSTYTNIRPSRLARPCDETTIKPKR